MFSGVGSSSSHKLRKIATGPGVSAYEMGDSRVHSTEGSGVADLATALRADAWAVIGRWLTATADLPSRAALDNAPPETADGLAIVGEMPAFLGALAYHLEHDFGDETADDGIAGAEVADDAAAQDSALRSAARAHARARAAVGYRQRDMLAEFVRLRSAIWDQLGDRGFAEPARVRLNRLLDAVLVETADHFFLELTDELTNQAERDELTGVYNRRAFYDRLQAELNRGKRLGYPVTVALIDLDGFKQVNDTLGHPTGDALLRRMGVLLTTHTREADLVGRLGGDEFAVALVGTESDGAHDLAVRLRVHLAPARRELALPGAFGLSIGSATSPQDGDALDELLFLADQRMYEAKFARKGIRRDVPQPPDDSSGAGEPDVPELTALVVEDDPAIRMLVRSTLEHEGWRVVEAPTLADARGSLAIGGHDVLLLDVHLPDGSGWELARELEHIRAGEAAGAAPPVVMMTGDTRGSYLQSAVQRGVADYLPKPFTGADVSGVLMRVLGRFAAAS